MLLRLLDLDYLQLLGMVQETVTRSQQHVVNAGLDFLRKGAVATNAEFQVRTVVTHHIDLSSSQFVSVFLIHPALYRLHNLWMLETVDVVPATGIATVAGEVAPVVHTLEGHAEVVALRIERKARMFDDPLAQGVGVGNVDVEATHSLAAVAREVEVAIGSEGGKLLVAGCVDGSSKVLATAQSVGGKPDAPKVQSA